MRDESLLIETLRSGADPASGLAPEVCFRSPVADYHGPADVAHLTRTIARVLDDVRPVRTLRGDGVTVTTFRASAAGRPLDGSLEERRDAGGRVVEATLQLRPLAALRPAIARMAAELAAAPLPSAA